MSKPVSNGVAEGLFQALFQKLDLREQLRRALAKAGRATAYGMHVVFLFLVVHILAGFRRLCDRDYYRDDPVLRRVLGVRRMPDTSTVTRRMGEASAKTIRAARSVVRRGVLRRLSSDTTGLNRYRGARRRQLLRGRSVCGQRFGGCLTLARGSGKGCEYRSECGRDDRPQLDIERAAHAGPDPRWTSAGYGTILSDGDSLFSGGIGNPKLDRNIPTRAAKLLRERRIMNASNVEILSGLAGYCYPNPEPVPGRQGRFVRRWVVRCSRHLPQQEQLDAFASRIEAQVRTILWAAYAEHISEERMNASTAGVRLVGIDDRHCVLITELPTSSKAVGDATGIGTWSSLRAVDEEFGIDDLEGLPKRMWFQLA